MTRRTFLSLLAALPFVGRVVRRVHPDVERWIHDEWHEFPAGAGVDLRAFDAAMREISGVSPELLGVRSKLTAMQHQFNAERMREIDQEAYRRFWA